jgi:hypothetical protein
VSKFAAAASLVFVYIALFSIPMSAQLIPHGNVYVGAAYSDSNIVIDRHGLKGWNASIEAIPLSRFSFLGLVIDASGYYGSGITQYNFLGGPRLAANFGKLRPFIHGLAGIQRVPVNGLTYQPVAADVGGGVDYKLPFRNFSWRLQGDYLHTHYLSASQNDFRASTGIVWRF